LLLIKGCDGGTRDPRAGGHVRTIKEPVEKKPLIDRLQVEGRREIAPDQTITILRIPDAMMPDLEMFDRRCFIYEHHEYRTSQMLCDVPE